MLNHTGKVLILSGLAMIIAGTILVYKGELPFHFGKLPGDIAIHRENLHIYFPFTSMILFSIILTIIIRLFRHFFK